MKKNLLTMLAAIFICCLAVTAMSACSSDNDNKTETPQEQTVKMFYVVEVSDDVLKVANVEVNYVDQTGAKQKEVMTSKEWTKALDTKTLPLTEGLWARITPKSAVASGNYQLKVTTAAGYQAKLTNGKTVYDGYGSDPDAAPTAAQTAEEVAAWCAKSPTVGFTVSKEGYAKQTKVDFGGNDGEDADNGLARAICRWFLSMLGDNPDDC
ncbi:hypothetical protein SAMN04488494_0146 [Xylanibacter ruminicola]|uniref:Lipoprotein n=1 Tax=Xylanibacter ruminicola TaxID=839 RepID=A0A1M7NRB2_XYLRU|nr:hypothetical protein [Xylanibacter ruminicola]SHN06385.1 hypothetical protein SAMN04488494_0146 [Xylanibacter ruminicola]